MTDRRFAVIPGAAHTGRQLGRWWTGDDLSDRWLHAEWLNGQYVGWFNRNARRTHDAEKTVTELEASYTQAEEDGNTKKREKLREKILTARELRDVYRAEVFDPLPFTEDDLNDTLGGAVRRRRFSFLAGVAALVILTRYTGGSVLLAVGGAGFVVAWIQGRWPRTLEAAVKLREEIDPALMAPPEPEPEPVPAIAEEPETVVSQAALVDVVRRGIGTRNGVHLVDLIAPLSKLGALGEETVTGVRTVLYAAGIPTKDSVKYHLPDGKQSVKEGVNAKEFQVWLDAPESGPERMPIGQSGYVVYPNGRSGGSPPDSAPPLPDPA
ncbi:hypothetical protein ACFXDJ_06700 [Streptomyces sp. NPDC059443]|uniref:hypothetical protein n=1 Tax=unclassified Streptomyces TaxID=2593676 RepID=UPI0036A9A68F